MSRISLTVGLLLVVSTGLNRVAAQEAETDAGPPSIAEKTKDFEKIDGFFPAYWDAKAGKVWLEIPETESEFLYQISLPSGLGSNDIGLDRGRLGPRRVVQFERVGPKLMLVAQNLSYRARTDNDLERTAVRDAFAESVVWGFEIAAETDGHYLVDATDFLVRDAMGIVGTLRQTNQGTYQLDKSRSAPHPTHLKSFPDNTELEARLTFTSFNPGSWVRSVAADAGAVTLRVRHSLVRLPALEGYAPRAFDPRSGYFGTSFVDYAVPIGAEKEIRWIARHRLHKRNPALAIDDVVEPIVYYLDPGTPEPIRSALIEGAQWWAQAFEAAGFRDAFRVEVLPDGADMLDVRYNVIQWVHRSTRGWSYGSSVSDPRTGEILKGHVSLGSLRVRQDYLIAEGLLSPYVDGKAPDPDSDPMLAMALARIRQLSAHEVGHTLGLAHNFAASVNDRASVMDYPAPLAEVTMAGEIELGRAYDTGIGEWDKVAIRYGYTEFEEGTDESAELDQILSQSHAEGLLYISDTDARPTGGAHPQAHLWDNDSDALRALEREMDVRQVALERFGVNAIRSGRPLATLEDVLVPLYLRHRYQVEAVVKAIGGVEYSYAIRGAQAPSVRPVDEAGQRSSIEALLDAVEPQALLLPKNIRSIIPPRPPGYGGTRELFAGYTGLTFDAYAPAEIAAQMVLDLLTHPQRAARLGYQHIEDNRLPGLSDMLARATERIWATPVPRDGPSAEVQRIVQDVWTSLLVKRAADMNAAPHVRAVFNEHLRDLQGWLEANQGRDAMTLAHRHLIESEVERFLFRMYDAAAPGDAIGVPPGSPIGSPTGSITVSTLGSAADRMGYGYNRRKTTLDQWITSEEVCAVEAW